MYQVQPERTMEKNSKQYDVIVVGEVNVDLIMNQLQSLPEIGKEKLSGNMNLTLGSSAAILANNLSALGAKVAFVGKAGKDFFGKFCKEELERSKVDTSMLLMTEEFQTGATVVLNFGVDRANVTFLGAMVSLKPEDITEEMISRARHLHFSSYFLQPAFKNKIHTLFKRAKYAGLTTSLDVQWDPQELWEFDYEKILPDVDIFLPNEIELLNLAKKKTVEEALALVGKYGNVIVVKKGKNGSVLFYKDQLIEGKPFLNNQVVDAIGAGDSFNAGFIFKFLKNNPAEKCQVFANLIGAVSTTAAGGTGAFINYQEVVKIAKEKFAYGEC